MFHISRDTYVNIQTQHHSHILVGESKADIQEGLHCIFNVQI